MADTVRGWFADDDDDGKKREKPPSHDEVGVAERQKLPMGRNAPKAKRVKELTDRRTANARYWQLSDGRIQAEVSAVPTSYRDGKTKSWKTVDTAVTRTGAKGFDFANTTNTGSSFFGSDPDRLVSFATPGGGQSVTFGLEGAGGSLKPSAEGNSVTYKDAVHGADLTYEVGPGRVKENVVLAERPKGPVSFTFRLDAKGLVPKAGKDGSVAFYGEAPNPVFVIPPAFMTDMKKSASSPYGVAYSSKVGQKLSRDGEGGWRLTVTPDAKWLADEERQYPVTVDPTLVLAPTPSQSQDTMVLAASPASNFDGNWRLSAGLDSAGSAARALVKFGLSSVPAGTQLDDARLQLYYDQTHTGVTNGAPVTLGAYRATGTWSAASATWDNTSGLVGDLAGSTTVVDNGETGKTAAVGSWPASSNTAFTQYAVNKTYVYNKDAVPGDTYTWQPVIPEDGTYQVDVHSVPAEDRSTAAPYTVTYDGGTKPYTVDQKSGTGGIWKPLGALPFKAGTAGKVVLGDGPASASTAVIADAVRFSKKGTVQMPYSAYNRWHSFSVKDTVQSWLDGTSANNGFVIKATDESSTAPRGGPRYEASEFGYGGESVNYPKLVLTYGRPGVDLDPPTTVHDTGAELNWSAYQNTSGSSGQDIAEYQVHRSVFQTFTPSSSTLVAPVDKSTTSYTDTSATPTAADSADPFGRAYYYMVAVKTRDGKITPAPTQLVRLPKAGRTTKVVEVSQDTTLSSAESTTPHDTITDGVPQNWLTVGNNSTAYGKTRTLLKFPALGIPSTARVLDAQVRLWGSQSTTSTGGAVYEMRPLTKDFDEATATWVKADATTNWATPGGDHGATVADTAPAMSNDPARHDWNVTSLAQSWVSTPGSRQGLIIKMQDEAASQERTVFLSSEAAEKRLHPRMAVTYIDSTTESTYYAPATPARMTPNSAYTVDLTLTNTSNTVWKAADQVLSYRWALPDGTDKTTGGNQVQTALPKDVVPGDTVTLRAQVKTPINSDSGNKRTDYALTWDLYDKTAGTWLSAGSGGIPGLQQNVAVEDPTSNTLGLEKFYSYTGKNTGAGSTVMNNLASGNSVWSYNAFTNPGRGLTTFARFAYNSLDTSDTVSGAGWSAQLAGPIRLGAPLDFHPNPNPTEIRLPDGDGTTHVFTKQPDGSWKAPAGVHYRVSAKAGLDCTPDKDPVPDAWTLLRPDGTRFLFGCDGYLTSVVDKNGNTQSYTYEERKSNNKPTKFLKYITDPAGRQSMTVDYYGKGDASYEYIDDTGAKVTGSKLNNAKIYDHMKSITDISGRKISFYYTDKGLLGQFTDGDGSAQPKVFTFTYDATQGNKNVKLVKATDPRGNGTQLTYYEPRTGDDPAYHWWTKTITDRLKGATGFTYAADATNAKFTDTTVTDAESQATTYVTDDFARPVRTTNAKSQTTKMSWDADNNVTYLEEANGAKTAYCYDQKTGYPLWQRDAENNKSGVPPSSDCAPGTYPANASTYEYQTRADGYAADLFRKTSPEGRAWRFGYDTFGNLKTVTDPKGVATGNGYTTTYEYDSHGQLTKATDARGNPTTNSDFGPTGYPETITDALDKSTTYVYDERGQVTSVTDALGKKTTQTYDTFGRALVKTVPKDQAAGVLITTPAPEYDANDNITKSTAPNGAVSTAAYDAADQITSATAPKDTTTSDERKTTYTYDKVGNLKTTTEPKGNLTTSDPADYLTTNHYDEIYQLTSVVNAKGDRVSYEYDNVGNATKVIDPKKNATADTTDYTTKTDYDLNHRVTQVTDAAGKTTKKSYDKDSLVTSTTDAENNTTLFTYDERGKQTEVKVPHDGTSTITYNTTKYEYDQVGNVTKVHSPRATAAGSTEAFTARTEYDALNRPVKRFQPYDPADARYNDPNVYTLTDYDAVGRVAKTSLPASEGQTVRNDTDYTYFDNGWTKSSTDPWDIVTTYDYTELGKQSARTLTSAGGSSNRTMGWSYYPDGKLKSRTDDGAPVGKSVVLVDNSDTQNTSSTGTWTKGNTTGQQGYDHQTRAAGTGTDAFTWTLNIPKDGTYTAYVKFPKVTGAATTAKYTVTHATGTTDKTLDQNSGTGTWVPLGAYTFKQGNDAGLRLFQNSAGVVVADAVKLVRDTSGDPVADQKRSFTYVYDANGNLTSITDGTPETTTDAYAITYTGLNQVQKVAESLKGQEKKATSYTYDANGQPETVTHPDQYSTYTYDLRELVKTVSVGKTATDTDPEVSSYTYTDRGLKLKETKANDNTVDYTYYLDGAIKTTAEKKANGTLVSSHTVTYDANGNKSRDVGKKMNADSPSAYVDVTADYTYDPVDRIAKVTKTGSNATTETYVHDDNANVISQTVKGISSTFVYDRNRMLSATVSGVGAAYTYDPFGRLESVTGGGKVVERNTYDGFDHVVESSRLTPDGGQSVTAYTYDPLDRTVSKTTASGTTRFNYLGLSEEVLSEEVSGSVTASYQYSPWGQRLSQIKRSGGTDELGVYGYNTRGDVESVTTTAGDTKATYGYTAYGKDDEREFTGVDKPADPDQEPYNPYRFNAKRWDVASGTYDMGFRDYDPELNRFTTRDMYNGALSDMRLGADPYTGNRYAFTGGNPVNRVEVDGHMICSEPGVCGSDAYLTQYYERQGASGDSTESAESGFDRYHFETAYDESSSVEGGGLTSAPEPDPVPAWENLLGGITHTVLTGFTRLGGEGGTAGICGGMGAAYGLGYAEQGCFMVVQTSNGDYDIGFTESHGPSAGMGASATLDVVYSNADSFNQIAGSGAGVDAAYGPLIGVHGLYGMAVNSEDELSLPGDLNQPWVVNSNGDPVWTAGGGVSLVSGFDMGGGTSYTTVYGASGW
ncbi:golvesin C-terminal-like domain-containing protein [Streptomyces bluensis]|uniref:DNRLRE domain-containing protein n=1 Tax=Streptomyces bluensis TaxID=33897 RepID=A0ABW6UGA9_9ACTN